MKFDTGRCVECGDLLGQQPFKLLFKNSTVSEYGLDRNGRIDRDDPFAFCSDICFQKGTGRFYSNMLDVDFYVRRDASRLAALGYRKRWYAEFALRTDKERQKEELEKQKELLKEREFQELIALRPIPENIRFEHTHILGASGSGKTTLIEHLFLEDMKKENPPAYVIIDPKSLLVDRIFRLKNIPRERIVCIDATRDSMPALNIFKPDIQATNPRDKARILNQLIETFGYIFSTADARLTQRQNIPFSYVVRLVFWMGGNINTLMDILDDRPKEQRFAAQIAEFSKTDEGARRFFDRDFYDTEFNSTRQQIRTRLYEIISRPELMQMFAAPENRLSLPQCLKERKIVLVNTAMAQLGTKTSALLGRYIIAATLNAAFSRFALPKDQWNPAFLVIDEFQDFADEEKTPEMLRLAREYNLGIVVAHQQMHCNEIKAATQTSISTNTSIKYSSSPEAPDLAYMARDLRCEPEFLRTQEKTATHAKFACFVRGMGLKHPFSVEVPFGTIQSQPQIDEATYQKLIARNDAALSGTPIESPTVDSPKKPYW